jgi:fibronectin type 3 domain-containing protein
VRAYDAQGHIAAAASSVAAGRTAPLPDPPEGLRVVSRLPRKVALGWKASNDPTVKGYVVARSPGAAGPFESIAELDGRHRTHYVDRGLGDLHVFYYQLRAVNAAGARGSPSEPVQGLTKPDPLPPAGVRLREHDASANVLEWEPNVEPDVVAYRVLRLTGKDDPETIGTVRAPATVFRDEDVPDGEAVSYQVIAIDADGLESAPAELPVRGSGLPSAEPGVVAAPAP